ncbi:MAG: thioredoxin domain-containing protein [Alphaproteobacteria bacterium]|nr:thioredoxin domain-containing protein [Alphaproteobacteria bacterium]
MSSRLAIAAALLGAALLGALAVAYGNARSSQDDKIDPSQKSEIEEVVHDYIIAHPEVLVESLNKYAEEQRAGAATRTREAAKKNLSELLNPKDGFIAGADTSKARVTVIEFFDYHCAFCKRAAGYVQELAKSDPAVEVIFREYPILRAESEYASEVALASRPQGKYLELYSALMKSTGVLTKERVKEIAESKGVDFNEVQTALKDPGISKSIDATHKIAQEIEVDGTPTFIIATKDGAFVDIVPGFDQDAIKAAIAKAKKAAK